jgi:predicted PurR-regulated permease PerM
MAALILVWRLVQDYVNSPRIMGRNLRLPPLVVLLAFMVGGQVGGIAGVFLSVPIVAILRTVWQDYLEVDESSTAYPITSTESISDGTGRAARG